MKTALQKTLAAIAPSFDASYLIGEKRLPYHLTPAAVESWTAAHGLTHSLHIGLDAPGAGLFSVQLINRATGYADASVTLAPGETRHDYGPQDRSFQAGLETLAREEKKRAHATI
jgi:hypothetical protein